MKKKLTYEEWEKLDDLLNKEGFGGYYDLLELLKMHAESWYKDKFGKKNLEVLEKAIQKVKTLHQITSLLSAIDLMKGEK